MMSLYATLGEFLFDNPRLVRLRNVIGFAAWLLAITLASERADDLIGLAVPSA